MSNLQERPDVTELPSNTHSIASGDPPSGGKPGRASSKAKNKNRKNNKKKPKNIVPQKQKGTPDSSVATDYATQLMDQTYSTPPVEAELRVMDCFQSVMTGTLYHLVSLMWHIARMPETVFQPAMYVMSQVSFDGYLFAFFIALAVSVKMSFVTKQLISRRLGYRANKMTGAVYTELGEFYTIDRGLSAMKFIGMFTTSIHETVFPSYLLDTHGFLMLAWIYSVQHIVVCLGVQNAWCRTRTWSQLYHNQETSKCGVANMDDNLAPLDTWFSCFEYGAGNLPGLYLRPSRMYIDDEDFRVSYAGLVACVVVNTWNCQVYCKGQHINSGAENLLVDAGSRSIIDLYHYNPVHNAIVPIVIDRQGNVVHNIPACQAAGPIDPYFQIAQAAGSGRYVNTIQMRHVFETLRDSNREVLTRAGTVFYDPNMGSHRNGAGVDVNLCEAVMLTMSYGGFTLCDDNYLDKLTAFNNYFHGDGRYYQVDNAGTSMLQNGMYVSFFEKHLTLLIPTVKSFCRFIPEIYLNAFKQFGLKLFKMPSPTTTGSTTQLFTSMPCYRGSNSMAYMDRTDNVSDYRPSLVGSSMILTEIRRNDMGLLVAPSIIVEKVCESSVLSGGTYQAAARSFVENPACALREFPTYNPGFQ